MFAHDGYITSGRWLGWIQTGDQSQAVFAAIRDHDYVPEVNDFSFVQVTDLSSSGKVDPQVIVEWYTELYDNITIGCDVYRLEWNSLSQGRFSTFAVVSEEDDGFGGVLGLMAESMLRNAFIVDEQTTPAHRSYTEVFSLSGLRYGQIDITLDAYCNGSEVSSCYHDVYKVMGVVDAMAAAAVENQDTRCKLDFDYGIVTTLGTLEWEDDDLVAKGLGITAIGKGILYDYCDE